MEVAIGWFSPVHHMENIQHLFRRMIYKQLVVAIQQDPCYTL